MSRKARGSEVRTREIIDGLFSDPPLVPPDLGVRLAAVAAPIARRLLIERLLGGAISEAHSGLLVGAFVRLGIGRESSRLIDIAVDGTIPTAIRGQAMAILMSASRSARAALMSRIPPEESLALAELSLADLLAAIQSDPERSTMLSTVLLGIAKEIRPELLIRIEAARQRAGTPAFFAYRDPLARDRLRALWPLMLEHLVEDGGSEAVRLLVGLRDGSRDRPSHRAFQGALMRIGTRAISPTEAVEPIRGSARRSKTDESGAFVVLVAIDNPDRTVTLLNLCLLEGGGYREAYVLSRRAPPEAEALAARVGRILESPWTEIDLLEAAEIGLLAARAQLWAGESLSPSARSAIALIERIEERGAFPSEL